MKTVEELVKMVEDRGTSLGDGKKFYAGTCFPSDCRKCIEECRELSKEAKMRGRVVVPTWQCNNCPCSISDFNI